jgi:hypothetical protein
MRFSQGIWEVGGAGARQRPGESWQLDIPDMIFAFLSYLVEC